MTLFEINRWLLNDLCRLAVDNLLFAVGKRGLDIGIFCAIHTYGRDSTGILMCMSPPAAVSLSTAMEKISFRKDTMRTRWIQNIRQLLLSVWYEGVELTVSLSYITTESQWRSLIMTAGGDNWHVYMSKKTAGGKNTVKYLGRYLKKPPISGLRLAHYVGGATLSFRYHDHNTGEQATETLTQREIMPRLKQHIPEQFFRMVRYFGFLAKRVCGEKLPEVYSALGMGKPEPVPKVCYAQMSKQFLRRDPFECVLCGGKMVYRRAVAGLSVTQLKIHAREISLMCRLAVMVVSYTVPD